MNDHVKLNFGMLSLSLWPPLIRRNLSVSGIFLIPRNREVRLRDGLPVLNAGDLLSMVCWYHLCCHATCRSSGLHTVLAEMGEEG